MRRTRYMAATLALLAVSPWVCLAGEKSDEGILREIKEVLWPRAYATQDVELLDSILADEFQMVDAAGNWTSKADEIEWVRRNAASYDSFVFNILRLDIFENGTAVVAGEGVIRGSDDEGDYVMTYQSSNILIKRDGAWRAVASHVSGIDRQTP